MCTLIAGVEVLGPRTLVLGANRDESPERASSLPGVLRERPRVVGGKDLVAGGTWLAVREARSVTALMNRRPARPSPGIAGSTAPRSRGLLCLDAAALGGRERGPARLDPGTGEPYPSRLEAALALVAREPYAACTLVGLEVDEPSWAILAEAGTAPEVRMLEPGWNVITHSDVNDPEEPRTAWVRARLKGFAPPSADEAMRVIAEILATHEDAAHDIPGVCLHRERFPTVSSSLFALGELGPARYFHAAGPPCETPYGDFSKLLR